MKNFLLKRLLLIVLAGMLTTILSQATATTTITIGTGTSTTYELPFGNYYKNSTTQCIYKANEIGTAGTIQSIAYNVASSSSLSATVKIYMGHRSGSTFSNTSSYISSGLSLVYSGSVTLGSSTGWVTYNLSTPFEYNGTDNLVVVVTKTASNYTNSLTYYASSVSNSCLYRQNDNTTEYANYTNTSYSYQLSSARPNIRLGIQEPIVNGATFFNDAQLSSSNRTVSYTFKASDGAVFSMNTSNAGGTITLDGANVGSTGVEGDYYSNGRTYQKKFTDSNTHTITINFTGTTSVSWSTYSSLSVTDVVLKHPGSPISNPVRNITLTNAGDLKYYITNSDKYYIRKLTISGPLNNEDIRLIRQMAGAEYYQVSGGSLLSELSCIDMTNAQIVSSGTAIGRCPSTEWGSYGDYYKVSSILNINNQFDDMLFCGLTALTEFTIPTSITNIGNGAFWYCSNLQTITFPANMSLQEIGTDNHYHEDYDCTFAGTNINRVNILDIAAWCSVSFVDDDSNPLRRSNTGNFYTSTTSTSPISSLVIPAGVTSIGKYAFCGCKNLTSVTFPSSITSIGTGAFSSCSALRSITANGGLGSVGIDAFKGCTAISSVNTLDLAKWCSSSFNIEDDREPVRDSWGNVAYDTNGDENWQITIHKAAIKSNPLYYAKSLKVNGVSSSTLTIPTGVETIGTGAFAYCQNIQTVTMPQTVKSVGALAFHDCNITKCVAEDISSWAEISFAPYYLANSSCVLGSPDEDGFYTSPTHYGTNIQTSNPLHYTHSLYVGNTEVVGRVTLDEGITSLGNYAFYGCTKITSIELPSTITTVYPTAILSCTKLDTIYSNAVTPPTVIQHPWNRWYSSTYYEYFDKSRAVYVPNASITQYQNANGWSRMRIFGLLNLMRNVNLSVNDDTMGTVSGSGSYNSGTTVTISANANEGHDFIRWSDGNTDNPRTITVSDNDVELEAIFAVKQFTLTTSATNGSVSGEGVYNYGTSITLTATGNEGYHFTTWSDGNTDNPREIILTNNVSLTAEFAKNTYLIGVVANQYDDQDVATTSGAGTYEYHDEATIGVTCIDGFHFTQWSDGNTDNPRVVIVSDNATYYASFAPDMPGDGPDTDLSIYDDVVYIAPADGCRGGYTSLSVCMNNIDAVYGYQFNLTLPEGVSFVTNTDAFGDTYADATQTNVRTNESRHTFETSIHDNVMTVLCYSATAKPFAGNNGEVARIRIYVDPEMAQGSYPIVLTAVKISLAGSTPIIPLVKSTLSVFDFLLGDANGDTDVNVGDITTIASYILGGNPTPFVSGAADANTDGDINVGDITTIASMILSGNAAPARKMVSMEAMYAEYAFGAVTMSNGTTTLPIVALNSEHAFSGFQFDIILPEGAHLNDIRLNEARAMAMNLSYSILENGVVRVLAYNISDTRVMGVHGTLVTVEIDTDLAGDNVVTLTNGYFSNRNECISVPAISYRWNLAEGINNASIIEHSDAKWYDLVGHELQNSESGIGITNGNKKLKLNY